jgi:O-antigen/teichoic acid export membrane protein
MSQADRFAVLRYAPRPVRALLAGRGIWALGDQALLSAGNFLTNILLIRHLAPEAFGNFAVLFSVLLFLNNLHASLVTYPLSVTAGKDDDAALRRRTRGAMAIALMLGVPFAAAAGGAAACIGHAALVPWVVAAMVLWQAQETLRRSMMARLQHHRAIPGDAVSYLGQVVAIGLLAHFHTLTVAHAFGAIALTSAVAMLLQAMQLKLGRLDTTTPRRLDETVSLGEQWRQYWSLGRWVLMSNLIGLVTVYATPWILRYFHGAGSVAAYQALSNLLGVSNPVVSSMAGLIVPAVAKAKADCDERLPADPTPLQRHQHDVLCVRTGGVAASRYGMQGLTLLLPYYAVLMLLPHTALHLFYGKNSPYLGYASLLRLFVLVYGLYYVSQVVFGLFNGLGRSRWSFYAQLCAAVANAVVCLPLAIVVGMVGAIWGGVVPMLAQLTVAAFLLRSLLRRPEQIEGAHAMVEPLRFEQIPEGVP